MLASKPAISWCFSLKQIKLGETSTIPQESGTHTVWSDPQNVIKQKNVKRGVKLNCKMFPTL